MGKTKGIALTPAEMALLERLVDSGRLIAFPPQANAKPRKVAAAALIEGGRRVALYLAKEVTNLAEE